MRIPNESLSSFLRFCDINSEHWRIDDQHQRTPAPDASIVLVDLLSHDFNHSVRACLTAKYLQRIQGHRLVGIIGNTTFNDVLFPDRYSRDHAQELARSYGIREFIELAGADNAEASDRQAGDQIRALPLEDKTEALFALEAEDGCEIGRYIYETCLRVAVSHKLLAWGPTDDRVLLDSYAIHRQIRAHTYDQHVAAYVTGHITFNKWGLVADAVLRGGGRVYYVNHDGNFCVDILKRPPQPRETLLGVRRKQRNALMDRYMAKSSPHLAGADDKVVTMVGSGKMFQPFWWVPQRQGEPRHRSSLRTHARAKLGLTDPKRPVYGIFTHCFSDAPTSDEQLYFDYYDWLVATLELAMADTSKAWICKVHPSMKSYGGEATMAEIIARFEGHAHIVFLHEELSKAELFAVCDLAVTIRGSLGYDMAAAGIPVVAAGRSPYSELGIAIVPETVDEYASLLIGPPDAIPADPGRADRARRFVLLNVGLLRVGSLLLMPNWSRTADTWNDLAIRLQSNMYELDPAFQSLAGSIAMNANMCVNLTFAAWIDPNLARAGAPPAWRRPDRVENAPEYDFSSLEVALDGGVGAFVLGGIDLRPEGGRLIEGRPALLYFPLPQASPEALSLFLELASPPREDEVPAAISVRVNGRSVATVTLAADEPRTAVVIDLPAASDGPAGVSEPPPAPQLVELMQPKGAPRAVWLHRIALNEAQALRNEHAPIIDAVAQAAQARRTVEAQARAQAESRMGRLRQTRAWQLLKGVRRRVRRVADALAEG